MKWWIRSQHPAWVVGTVLLGTAVVIAAPGSTGLPIPSLAGPTAFAAIRPYALVAVLITVAMWASVSAGHKSAVLSTTRLLKFYVFVSPCGVLVVCGLMIGAWAIVAGELTTPLQLLFRDLIGLLGLGLILVSFTGYRYAGISSTVYVFVSAIFGRTSGGGAYDSALWAWPIADSTAFDYWIPAAALFVTGALVWLLRSRDHYSRVMINQAMDTRRE
ncbi:MAG: putative rane protein [Glaciihabitans sp.]|jgi:hypothetical protein|nr:putative rane protein [Glaciihabitans sp.]